MFGHQDDLGNNNQSSTATMSEPVADGTLAASDTPAIVSPVSAPITPDPITPDPVMPDPEPMATATAPAIDDSAASDYIMTDAPHADGDTKPAIQGEHTDDLLNIKQQALEQLSPLVDHLDQSPEEKFKTTMMMIQASDDQSLIKSAYDAAKEITDEKTRAQALLDVVNEINYFTQHQAA